MVFNNKEVKTSRVKKRLPVQPLMVTRKKRTWLFDDKPTNN